MIDKKVKPYDIVKLMILFQLWLEYYILNDQLFYLQTKGNGTKKSYL